MMTLGILELTAFIIYAVVVATLLTLVILMSVKIAKLQSINAQLNVDLNIYLNELSKALDAKDSNSIEETQGFIKFISDSRDKAFEYIYDIQAALEQYRQIADVIPLSKDMSVEQAKKLSEAYDKLMDFLPKEDLV